MRLTAVTLHGIRLPLVEPFTTSFARWTDRESLLVEVRAEVDGVELTGWGECAAFAAPSYTPEHVWGCAQVIEQFLVPLLGDAGDIRAVHVGDTLRPVKGNRMAKAAIEMAVLDAELKASGRSLADYLGGTVDRVPSGIAIGLHDSTDDLVGAVGDALAAGYQRVKLKIAPGADIDRVAAVRAAHGQDFALQVDANGAYTLADVDRLRGLDDHGLLLIEQPLPEGDFHGHAALAEKLDTPICLDESIDSYDAAAHALALGAASVLAIKPGRVGGYLEARRLTGRDLPYDDPEAFIRGSADLGLLWIES
jgi:O-succinylbenzoate synthase